MGILRESDDVLLQMGSMEDSNLLYVSTTTERTDEIWLLTSILPVLDGDRFIHYDSAWFFIAPNMYAFLRLLKYEPQNTPGM
ncbi:MAG: hypothetical protein O2856_18860 [Planctomycetota bacterium]|nr:hypothetical protein [Planctomycetota bacterium]